jgi:hypothetical protein
VRTDPRDVRDRRVGRLLQLGFDDDTAEQISELHTANFM